MQDKNPVYAIKQSGFDDRHGRSFLGDGSKTWSPGLPGRSTGRSFKRCSLMGMYQCAPFIEDELTVLRDELKLSAAWLRFGTPGAVQFLTMFKGRGDLCTQDSGSPLIG